MADNFELANDTVVESGYKRTEEVALVSASGSNTAAPSAASDGEDTGSNSRAILVAWSNSASVTFDATVWAYLGTTIGWRRIRSLDKTSIDGEGDTWKANIGGIDRIYVQIENIAGVGAEANVSILKAYS